MEVKATEPAPRLNPQLTSQPRLKWVLGLGLIAVTLLLYWRVGQFEFICFDDEDYVTLNEPVLAGLTLDGFRWAFNIGYASNWHPLTWLSHMLDCQFFGLKAGSHHLVNVGLHALNAALLFLVLTRMTASTWRSAIVAALFAWHPLHVESVAWVSERKDVLSTFFGLLTLLAYSQYAATHKGRWRWFALLLFALGLSAKPMLVTLPCVLLLLDYWPLGRLKLPVDQPREFLRHGFKLALEKWPFFMLSAASAVITVMAQRKSISSIESFGLIPRLANALTSYVRYLGKTFWPTDLAIFYPYPGDTAWWIGGGAALLLAGVSFVVCKAALLRPYLLVGWLWFLGTLVPVIGLVQVGFQSMADRYTYLPLVGVFIMVVWGVADLCPATKRSKLPLLITTGMALLVCIFLTTRQLAHWRDSIVLFEHALRVTEDNPTSRYSLGLAYERTGNRPEARRQFLRAIELNPNYPRAYRGMGSLAYHAGQIEDAYRYYNEALRHEPDDPGVMWNTGVILIALGDVELAFERLQKAAALKPHDAGARFTLGMELIRHQRSAEAVGWLEEAIRLKPNWIEPLQTLAWVLAVHPDAKVRNGSRAMQVAERACELTSYQALAPLDAYAAACAEAGQFEKAVQLTERAALLAQQAGRDGLRADIEARLSGYRRQQPHRDPKLGGL